MRICLVGLEKLPIPPRRGGAIEKGIVEVSRRYAKNHSVAVLALGGRGYPSHERVSGMEYYREDAIPLANSTLGKYLFYNNLLKHLRKIDPDIIHIHIRPTLTYLTRLYSDAPNVISIHSYGFRMAKYPFSIIEDRLIHLGFKNCAAIMPCSNHVGLWLNKCLGVEERKIRVVHRGVDTAKFRYDERLAEHVMKKHDLHRKKVLVYIGRIVPQKGVHVLLKAFHTIKKRIPNVVLFIIGPPGEFNAPRCSDYALELMRTSPKEDVYFLGELSENEIIPYICSCDVFIYPSIWEEPFGIAVIEAMACERPVVASRVGGISEIIDNERTGILTAPNDAPQLANAVIRLFEEPHRAQGMGREARREVQRRFTWDKAAENYLKVYKEVTR